MGILITKLSSPFCPSFQPSSARTTPRDLYFRGQCEVRKDRSSESQEVGRATAVRGVKVRRSQMAFQNERIGGSLLNWHTFIIKAHKNDSTDPNFSSDVQRNCTSIILFKAVFWSLGHTDVFSSISHEMLSLSQLPLASGYLLKWHPDIQAKYGMIKWTKCPSDIWGDNFPDLVHMVLGLMKADMPLCPWWTPLLAILVWICRWGVTSWHGHSLILFSG